MTMILLAPSDEAMAQRIAEIISARAKPVLTLEQAIPYTNHKSDSAFYVWAKKWKVTPCDHGRYARGHLDRALEREAQSRGKKRKLKVAA